MKITEIKTGRTLGLLVLGLLVTAGAMAEKPEWVGGGKPAPSEKPGRPSQPAQKDAHGLPDQAPEGRNGNSPQRSQDKPVLVGGHFGDAQRTVGRNYFSEQYRVGRCPPGLAKKNNGCLPPGQARKWVVGQPLPRDVVYYSLPPALVVQLGAPPAGHRYVRVASDILLITIGTRMVIDAMQDLDHR